jgi:hypothetical protein
LGATRSRSQNARPASRFEPPEAAPSKARPARVVHRLVCRPPLLRRHLTRRPPQQTASLPAGAGPQSGAEFASDRGTPSCVGEQCGLPERSVCGTVSTGSAGATQLAERIAGRADRTARRERARWGLGNGDLRGQLELQLMLELGQEIAGDGDLDQLDGFARGHVPQGSQGHVAAAGGMLRHPRVK